MSMTRWSKGVLWLVLAVALSAPPAVAQSADLKALMDRLERLERDIRTLNVRLSRGGQLPPAAAGAGDAAPSVAESAMARLDIRLTELENEVRGATGRAEELSHHLDGLNQRLDKLIADMDYRLSVLERAGPAPAGPGQAGAAAQVTTPAAPPAVQTASPAAAASPGVLGHITQSELDRARAGQTPDRGATPEAAAPAAPAAAEVPPTGVLPEGPPETQYAHAFGLLRQTKYDDAEAALAEFVRTNPNHRLTGNARYWLGETYYVRNDYARAAEVFLDGYQNDPKGSKAADALLKLGMSLLGLDKVKEACAAFDKLARDLPDAPPNILKTMERQRGRAGCR